MLNKPIILILLAYVTPLFADLPKDITWLTNDKDPTYSDPEAKRGGTFHTTIDSFPITLRTIGPDANGSFRSVIGDNELTLISIHPNTDNIIPVLATHWAYGKDKKTMYFKINPKAVWSDGNPVTADDFLFTMEYMRSKHIVAPWYNDYYTNTIADVKKIDSHTIEVIAAKPSSELHLNYIDDLRATPKHFYKTIGPDFVKKYNWEIIPNNGPYQVSEVKKGKSITLKRKADWWGNDLRFFKNRFNVDKVEFKVIRDLNVAFEHFRKGELEVFGLTAPDYWHDKSKIPEFENGYAVKLWFYTSGPQTPMGLYLNQDKENLNDQNVRLGLQHSTDVDGMITKVLRNEYERLPQSEYGYGRFTNSSIKARKFDLAKAEEYFTKAGWKERGSDGIRLKDGKRLSFTITYGVDFHTPRLVYLKEQAKKAGVELKLELLDGTTSFKKMLEKKHEIAWMAWSTGARPSPWQGWHSDNAHKTQTNNITNTDDKELDKLIDAHRNSLDVEEQVKLIHKVQQRIHDIGAFVPTYMVPYFRVGYYRYWRLPKVPATRISESAFSLFETRFGGLFWLDEKLKEETLKAKKAGQKFPPVVNIDKTFKDT